MCLAVLLLDVVANVDDADAVCYCMSFATSGDVVLMVPLARRVFTSSRIWNTLQLMHSFSDFRGEQIDFELSHRFPLASKTRHSSVCAQLIARCACL